MNDVYMALMEQVPGLMVLGFIVVRFLSHQERDRLSHRETVKQITETGNVVQRDATTAIHNNTLMLGEVREALHNN